MDHRLDVRVAEFGCFLDAPFKGLVVVADEFKVNANVDLAHKTEWIVGVLELWSGGLLPGRASVPASPNFLAASV
jgi:hypothetical protein